MEIREATIKDIPQIKSLIDRNFDEVMSKAHSKPVLEKFKTHNSLESLASQLEWKTIYVAVQEDEVVATGALANFGNEDVPKYAISNLYVKPECHTQGTGRLLCHQLFQHAKEKNAPMLHVPSSLNAIGFYEKMGFTVDEEQADQGDEITWMTISFPSTSA